jgi:hypothetical protein
MDLCVADVHQVFAQAEDNKGDRNVLDTSHHSTIILRSSIVRYHPLAYDFFKDELTAQRTELIL